MSVNLKEMCEFAGIQIPVFKKYQMIFSLGKGEKHGRRTYYSRLYVIRVERIAAARRLGFSYYDIKRLLTNPIRFAEEARHRYQSKSKQLERDFQFLKYPRIIPP